MLVGFAVGFAVGSAEGCGAALLEATGAWLVGRVVVGGRGVVAAGTAAALPASTPAGSGSSADASSGAAEGAALAEAGADAVGMRTAELEAGGTATTT
ncbi:MAG: hypothetical protein J0I07_14375, partial [Myxococcales bacterium]|nr:hypothetical protein [Myxococcales bacterium]